MVLGKMCSYAFYISLICYFHPFKFKVGSNMAGPGGDDFRGGGPRHFDMALISPVYLVLKNIGISEKTGKLFPKYPFIAAHCVMYHWIGGAQSEIDEFLKLLKNYFGAINSP